MKANRTKGVTMIELIIVVAIMGIFTGVASLSFQYIKSGNVKAAAKTIDASLSQLRYDAMSKANTPIMYIYKDSGNYYLLCTADASKARNATNGQLLCNGNCKITYDNDQEITTPIKIIYKKGSGGFASNSDVKEKIVVKDNSGTAYTIVIVEETGKHYVEVN